MLHRLTPPGGPAGAEPRFCPNCRKAGPDEGTLCPECGEVLVPQGYCATCESYWPLAAGTGCPKHDLPLLESRPEPILPDWGRGKPIDWATAGTYSLPFEAEAARLRLDAEGIPAYLDGLRMGIAHSHPAIGGIRLQVPRPLLQDARILLSQNWSVPGDEEDLDDDPWDLPPDHVANPDLPPPTVVDWRAPVLFWGVVLALSVVVLGIIAGIEGS